MIGSLEKTVIDCPNPRALAEFYCQVLGMRIDEDVGGWVVIGSGHGHGSVDNDWRNGWRSRLLCVTEQAQTS